MSEHLEYRQFDVLQPGPDPDAGMLGSFIIGIPAMTFREFQNNHPYFEPEPATVRELKKLFPDTTAIKGKIVGLTCPSRGIRDIAQVLRSHLGSFQKPEIAI